MEAKIDAKDCMIFGVLHDLTQGETKKAIRFPHTWETEVEVVPWLQDFRIGTEDSNVAYTCDCWASDITNEGFTAQVSTSRNVERLVVTWIVYKKGKKKVASGTVSTEDIEDREEEAPLNSGRVEFAHGHFQKPPTVLMALSQFDLAGGRDLRVGAFVEDIDESGFTWHLSKCCGHCGKDLNTN